MLICVTKLWRCRISLAMCVVALAVASLTEAPRAKAEDIVKGVDQVRHLDLYYAAITTVIPTATLVAELSQDGDDKWRDKIIKNGQYDQTTITLIESIANATSVSSVGLHANANNRNNDEKSQKTLDVYRSDELTQSAGGTKLRTNTQDQDKRTTNKSKEKLKALNDRVQQDVKETMENIDIVSANERTLPLNLLGGTEYVNRDNNNIYNILDEDEENVDDVDEDEENVMHISRTRKDTSEIEGVTWQSLQRLADLATASNPNLLINLVTPNPDIEITIEVLSGAEENDDQLVLANEVTQTKPRTKPGKKGKGKGRRGKNKKDKNRDRTGNKKNDRNPGDGRLPNIPDKDNKEEETNKPVENGDDSSYSYHIGGPLLSLIPDDFEDFNFNEDTFPMEEHGAWSEWSRCSATCGGGRTERSRSCGFSCTSTETQDCNQHSCPEIEYIDSQIIAGIPPVETSSPPVQTTDELYRFLDQNLAEFEKDSCAEWMSCRSEKLMSYLSRLEDLPSCPCLYPTTLGLNDLIWDKSHKKMFRWIESDKEKERLDIYKPTAHYCIRSLLTAHSTSLAAQQCCYDEAMKLITRGPGAGTPKLISREISPELNYKIDILPWLICKGDWSKYNTIRHPNNARGCREFPGDEAYHIYLDELKDF